MTKIIIAFILLVIASATSSLACTSFIVSGRITPDGRPLLFKNRDTGDQNNHVVVVQGEKYLFEGVTADRDKDASNIWMGHNEKGFAIINTDAYNLNGGKRDTAENDGHVMRRALEICATLADFEHYLDTLPRPMHLDSNFGVIDAQGGCAYYETGNEKYVKYDANDPAVAPNGFLVRTNHGMSGDRNLDKGVERYFAISQLMNQCVYSNKLDAEYLITTVPRYLVHGLTGQDLSQSLPEDSCQRQMAAFADFIPRYLTSSAVLYQGVRKGEDPLLTVAWTIIGNPLTTEAVPVVGFKNIPAVLLGNQDNRSELCQKGLKRKEQLFPFKRSNGQNYIDRSKLENRQGTGILQKVRVEEAEIMKAYRPVLQSLRSGDKDSWQRLYKQNAWLDTYVRTGALI
jgi:hypothetical protein